MTEEQRDCKALYLPKKRLKSAVWDYFGYPKDAEGVIQDNGSPFCKMCRKQIAAKGSNTSNLLQHLQDHHPALHAEIKVL